jgi:hypothetical protein
MHMTQTGSCAANRLYSRNNFSLDDFAAQCSAYLTGNCERPWCEARSVNPTDNIDRIVQFTFGDRLIRNIVKFPRDFEKDLTDALSYGYIAHANGGRNGIVLLRTDDLKMRRRVANYAVTNEKALWHVYNIRKPNEGVKIVCHRPNGVRTIGVMDPDTNRILFFDQKKYS